VSPKVVLSGKNPFDLSPDKLDGLAADLRAEGFEVEIDLGFGRAPKGFGVTFYEVLSVLLLVGTAIANTEGILQAKDRLLRVIKGWQDKRFRPQHATIYDDNGNVVTTIVREEPRQEFQRPYEVQEAGFPPRGHADALRLDASVLYEKADGSHGRTDVAIEAASSEFADLLTYRGCELAQLDRGARLRRAALLRHRWFSRGSR
jgi:hypothetical protein